MKVARRVWARMRYFENLTWHKRVLLLQSSPRIFYFWLKADCSFPVGPGDRRMLKALAVGPRPFSATKQIVEGARRLDP
jgi:hypothetical protein